MLYDFYFGFDVSSFFYLPQVDLKAAHEWKGYFHLD